MDSRIWRVIGGPLVRGAADGPLAGESVAVKDLYAVAGQRIGAGNPAWLAAAPVEPSHAFVVEQLLAAGADVIGVAHTDEFAYSLAGTNAHSGTPPNPRAPLRISGGSTSGPASAVSRGQVTIGLGTDTGGSIRVPAAYQGLYGHPHQPRPVPTDGLLPLSPGFDTVGWLTQDAALLARVGEVLLPDGPGGSRRAGRRTRAARARRARRRPAAIGSRAERLGATRVDWDLGAHPGWLDGLPTLQAWEAWRERGVVARASGSTPLGPDVRARFEYAASISADAAEAAARDVRRVLGPRSGSWSATGSWCCRRPPRSPRGSATDLRAHPRRDDAADLPGRARRAARGERPAHHAPPACRRCVPGRRARPGPRPADGWRPRSARVTRRTHRLSRSAVTTDP